VSAINQLDTSFVRQHFPGLNEWALFENAGGTLVPQSVIDRVRNYMTETQVQPGAAYPASALATERIDESQRLMAEMINATPEEIVIGPSSTMNVYVLSHALRSGFKPGDEVIVTNLDHETNIGAWRRLAQTGVVIKEWRLIPETAELAIEDLEALLTERTRLVCFTYCSNITGSITDVQKITRLVHDAGARVCVDAVAYAPHRSLDMKALDVDFLIFSTYKLYGPHLAILYGKREHLLAAEGQNHFFIGEGDISLKLNPGGVNHELTAGLGGITDYFDALYHHHFPGQQAGVQQRVQKVFKLIADHEEALAQRFVDFLLTKPKTRLIGRASTDKSQRTPTFSFVVEGRDSEEIPRQLLERGLAIRAGDFYATRCIEALGVAARHGVIRASMVHYNTLDEVDRLIVALEETL
jgi:cysteine desulfurase family protein (TIGR01976 family)